MQEAEKRKIKRHFYVPPWRKEQTKKDGHGLNKNLRGAGGDVLEKKRRRQRDQKSIGGKERSEHENL